MIKLKLNKVSVVFYKLGESSDINKSVEYAAFPTKAIIHFNGA